MANPRAALTQAELTRIAKAMRKADIAEWRVEVEASGKHTIIAGKVDSAKAGPDPDELLR